MNIAPSQLPQMITRFLAFLIGVGIFGMLLVMLINKPSKSLPRHFFSPIAAMELALDKNEAKSIIQITATSRGLTSKSTKKQWQAFMDRFVGILYFDQFVIVPVYTCLLILLGLWWLSFSSHSGFLLWFAILLSTVIACFSDSAENIHTLYVLQAYPNQLTDALIADVRLAAYMKWSAIGLSLTLLGVSLLKREQKWPKLATLFILSGLGLGFGAFFSPPIRLVGLMLMGASLITSGVHFIALIHPDSTLYPQKP